MNNLTEGSIIKSIITLSIPVLIANLLQTAYQLIDTFWVGRLNAEAVAAVSLSFPIIFFIISFAGGIGLAGAVFVAQYKGRGDRKNLNHIAGQTLFMAFLVSIVFSTIGYLFTPLIIKLFGARPEVFSDAVRYLRISFLGLVFVFGYLVFQSIMRAVGDAKTPAYIVLATVLLNALLDPLFIFGYGPIKPLGVSGAAMATFFTQSLALLIGMTLLIRGKSGIHLGLDCFKPDLSVMKKIIKLAVPISFEQSSRSVGFAIMTILVASFGTITLAAYGIGMRMASLVIIPATSLAIANSTLVGQNMGAGKVDRADKTAKVSLALGFATLSFIGIVFFIFSKGISALFIPGDPDVIFKSSLFLKTIALAFGLTGVQMAVYGALRGAGQTFITMKIALFVMIFQLALAFFLSKYTILGEFGLWLSLPVSNILGSFILMFIFLKGDWKRIRLTE